NSGIYWRKWAILLGRNAAPAWRHPSLTWQDRPVVSPFKVKVSVSPPRRATWFLRRITGTIFTVTLLIFSGHAASAGVLTFDDAYAALGQGGNPATYYSSEGVTISGTYFGLVGGVGNGDPGNWSLEGTNGYAFLGCNEGDSCSPTFTFTSPQDVSLDI